MRESGKWKWRCSVVSNSSRPHGLQPTRLLRPWDFPGKGTGVGCLCLLWIILQLKINKNFKKVNSFSCTSVFFSSVPARPSYLISSWICYPIPVFAALFITFPGPKAPLHSFPLASKLPQGRSSCCPFFSLSPCLGISHIPPLSPAISPTHPGLQKHL